MFFRSNLSEIKYTSDAQRCVAGNITSSSVNRRAFRHLQVAGSKFLRKSTLKQSSNEVRNQRILGGAMRLMPNERFLKCCSELPIFSE